MVFGQYNFLYSIIYYWLQFYILRIHNNGIIINEEVHSTAQRSNFKIDEYNISFYLLVDKFNKVLQDSLKIVKGFKKYSKINTLIVFTKFVNIVELFLIINHKHLSLKQILQNNIILLEKKRTRTELEYYVLKFIFDYSFKFWLNCCWIFK